MHLIRLLTIGVALSLLVNSPVIAEQADQQHNASDNTLKPIISLIIDDLGEQISVTKRTIALPGRFNCSFLPVTGQAAELAHAAHIQGKEIMLHLPMEAQQHNQRMGDIAFTQHMQFDDFQAMLKLGLARIPHLRGVNNHMGSLLTQVPHSMQHFMASLSEHQPLFFVDSRTTSQSIAASTAENYGIPHVERDIFLDNQRNHAAISQQFERLIRIAEKRGSAVAIAHPYPETLSFLEQTLPQLEARGIILVPISELLQYREQQRNIANSNPLKLSLHPGLPSNTH